MIRLALLLAALLMAIATLVYVSLCHGVVPQHKPQCHIFSGCCRP